MQPPRIRVALLTTSWPRDEQDATGRFLANQVARLEAAGVDVLIVAPRRMLDGAGNAARREARDSGFRDFGLTGGAGVVANIRRRPWRVPLLLASMAIAIRRAARSANVVHANWLITAPIAAVGGRPVVLTLHGSGTAGRFEDLALAERRPRLFRWLIRRAAVVTGVSQLLTDAARSAGARCALEIPHGVDVPERTGAPAASNQVTALFAGRLSPEKGVDVLVEAFEQLDGVQLVVAGDGPERERLERAALGDRMELLGFVSQAELGHRLDGASMLVMPSRREGFGVVALEAMARGVPVVASRVGGLARLVEHERTGLLVPPGDASALRAAIERLRDDPALCSRLGAMARARASEQYGWDRVTAAMLEAYELAARGESGS